MGGGEGEVRRKGRGRRRRGDEMEDGVEGGMKIGGRKESNWRHSVELQEFWTSVDGRADG